jgi:DNA-binding NarL/FixJ family response regulator
MEAGSPLIITHETASVHVSHVLSKLGASRRAEAAAVPARLGIVDDSAEAVGTA